MLVLKTLIICAAWLAVHCQGPNGPTTTPVPILKQINRQNDDGSYSYGYEAADGSFKIETKYPNGDVAGKYGYVDAEGKTREISYGASSQRGFEPEGPGIMVPPPTLNNNQHSTNALTDGQEDDGQYREDPSIYEDPKYNSRAQPRPASVRQYHQPAQPAPARQYQPAPIPTAAPAPQYQQQSQFRSAPLYSQQTSLFNQGPQQFPSQNQFQSQNQEFRPQSQVYHQQPQFSYQAYTPQPSYQGQNYQGQNYQFQQSQYQPQQNYQSQNQNYNPFFGHPAQNFDPNTGSYSINFTG
ncbi:hypothetical protein PYW08_001920 [Mythimna loreyi]|uniref:Uncharacterized protein n=1 Tax=Mythimna loreyi TaxID=667449 RepID=A0ACC2R2E9_9NEOP|nr:hypothetical protein PYW08_001920 [Mythimna loreyi]